MIRLRLCRSFISFLLLATWAGLGLAHTHVPAIFGSNMVLQQKQPNKVWGWDHAGQTVTVTIGNQTKTATADADGAWHVWLDPLPAGGPHQLQIKGDDTLTFDNVLVGEVWVCSGQSNMQWAVNSSNDPDLEAMTANYPNIRLISVPQVGTQEPQKDFDGRWTACTPKTVRDFSAVGYFFGRTLHQALDVPIGLIDNAWGGSACEAWIERSKLKGNERFQPLVQHWEKIETNLANQEDSQKKRRTLGGNQRPSNIYNGVLKPTIGYGIKGVVWYQGETNASRAYQYRDLFPFMIKTWRDEWAQGDFPFYWVQLADFRAEKPSPSPSDWAELREAQTMTMDKLPNTGEAVIIDLGEAADIHPKNKQDVAKRLARWALVKDYGKDIVYRSPRYKSMEVDGPEIVLTFDHVGGGLDTFDVRTLVGFTIAGDDQVFHPATAKFVGKGRGIEQIRVSSPAVANPVAARYAWADNPVCNLQNQEGLPLTPFRTDQWKGVTEGRLHP